MLLCEQCSGHEYGNLFAAINCREACPQGNFGLTKANITTNQAIHRAPARHILDDVSYCPGLIIGFGKRLNASAINAFNQYFDRAIGQLQQLQDV